MQALGPSLLPFQDEPFPGAGEQMRWSYWQAGRLGHRLGRPTRSCPSRGFLLSAQRIQLCLWVSLTSCAVHIMMCL